MFLYVIVLLANLLISFFDSFGSVPNLLDLDDMSDKENGPLTPSSSTASEFLIDGDPMSPGSYTMTRLNNCYFNFDQDIQ